MIKVLKKAALFLVALLLIALLLIQYMSSPTLNTDTYAEIMEYDNPSVSPDTALSIMTFNIGYLSGMTNNRSIARDEVTFDKNLTRTKRLIKDLNPSIVGLQEIDFAANRSFDINQLDSIAVARDFAAAYRSINWDKTYVPFPYWPPSNHFGRMLSGQAILSRYQISSGETIVLDPNGESPFWYKAFYLDRLLQITEIDFNGTPVKIMNVHLEAFDRKTRLKQIARVKREFEKYATNQPVLLVGDFNSEVPDKSESGGAMELLMKAKDIASAIPFDKESANRTFSSEKPVRMIDYIFYNENFIRCVEARTIKEAGQISDHLPVFGRFELK